MTPEGLTKETQELRNSIAKARAESRKAVRDIGKRGVAVTVTVMDASGASRQKPGINPSVRVLRESQRAIKIMEQRLAALEKEQHARQPRKIELMNFSEESE